MRKQQFLQTDAEWSMWFLHRRLWRTGQYTEEATIERMLREHRKATSALRRRRTAATVCERAGSQGLLPRTVLKDAKGRERVARSLCRDTQFRSARLPAP